MKTFDEAVQHAKGRLVEAKEVIGKFEHTNLDKRRPKPVTPTPPAKTPKGKAT